MNKAGAVGESEAAPRAADRPLPLGEALSRWMERSAWLWLVGLMALCCIHLLWRSTTKFIWFDELFTQNLAEQPSWGLYWSGLPADANPPLGSMLAWVSVHLFGSGALALRLPSLLAFLAASILVYRILSIRLGRVAGLLGILFLNANPAVSMYAIEARPYALVLFFTVAAFASWQAATDEHHPRAWAKWAVAASIAGAVLTHHYAVLNAGLPLLFGEGARSIQRRRIDWPLAACACIGLLPLTITVFLAHRTQSLLLQYSNLPRGLPRGLLRHPLQAADYDSLLTIPEIGLVKILVVVVLYLLVRSWWNEGRQQPKSRQPLPSKFGWPAHEFVALWASTFSLFVIFLISSMSSVYFSRIRYGIGSFFGIVALVTTLFALFDTQVQAVLVLMLSWPMLKSFPRDWHTYAEPAENACLRALPNGPIVVADTLKYPALWHYADPALRARLFYLADGEYAKKQMFNSPELALILQKPIFPMNLVDYSGFLPAHPDFLVMASGVAVQDYALDHLRESGYQLTPIDVAACPSKRVYQASRR